MNKTITARMAFSIVIASVLVAMGIGWLITTVGSKYYPQYDQRFFNYFALFAGQGLMVIPVLLYLAFKKEPIRHRLRFHPISLRTTATVVLIAIGVIILADELDRLAAWLFPVPEYLNDSNEVLSFDTWGRAAIIVLGVALLAPLGEELLFRGFLQTFLEEHWKDVTRAVLITSLLFAAIHLNPYWVIQIYLLGVILGYLAWRTGSILGSLILHGLNNGIALVFNNYGEIISPLYIWRGHVSPFFLALALGLLWGGFKQLENSFPPMRTT